LSLPLNIRPCSFSTLTLIYRTLTFLGFFGKSQLPFFEVSQSRLLASPGFSRTKRKKERNEIETKIETKGVKI